MKVIPFYELKQLKEDLLYIDEWRGFPFTDKEVFRSTIDSLFEYGLIEMLSRGTFFLTDDGKWLLEESQKTN